MPTIAVTPDQHCPQPSAVALVVHGLNYRPNRMQPVSDSLSRAGVECICLSLYGHGDNYLSIPGQDADSARLDAFCNVTLDRWLDEVCAAYAIASVRANRLHVPLIYSGYSLGGFLGCIALTDKPSVHFDGMLLFAPALVLDHYSIAMLLAKWLPNVIVPSLSPTVYRANLATPSSAYLALFEGIERLHAGDLQRMNVPTLVFMDERDELVFYGGVKAIADNLSNWRMVTVHKSAPVAGHAFHHLVIGNAAVGVTTWANVDDRIVQFVCARCAAHR